MNDVSYTRTIIWGFMLLLIIGAYVFRLHLSESPEMPDVRLNTFRTETGTLFPAEDISVREDDVAVIVSSVGVHPGTGSPAVFLLTEQEDAYIPIFIGPFEASAISRSLEGLRPPRPMTHELLSDVIDVFGGRVTKVVVSSLENGTFKAVMALENADGETGYLDARPSDAIAIALLKGADVYVAARVMEEAGYRIEEDGDIPKDPLDPDGPGPQQWPEGELI